MFAWLHKSILLQIVIPTVLNLGIAVVGSTLASELMSGQTVNWVLVYTASSTWILVVLVLLLIGYLYLVARHHATLARAQVSPDQQKLRDLTTGEMADAMKEVIKTGRASGVFTVADVKRMWGIKK